MGALESAREASACQRIASTTRAGPSDVEIASSIDRYVCCMQPCSHSSEPLTAPLQPHFSPAGQACTQNRDPAAGWGLHMHWRGGGHSRHKLQVYRAGAWYLFSYRKVYKAIKMTFWQSILTACVVLHAVRSSYQDHVRTSNLITILCNGHVRLDEQLGALEGRLGEADSHVQHLLGHSTALWMAEGTKLKGKDSKGEAEETQQAHDGTMGEDASKDEAAGAGLNPPSLLPITQQ